MGNKTFQVFLFIVLAFNASYAAKHPICLSQIQIMQAKSVTELEKMMHPLCLKEKVTELSHRKFSSLNDWKKAYQFLKMAERVPQNWQVVKRVLPFLEANKKNILKYDLAWALLESHKNQKIIKLFLEGQPLLVDEIQQIKRSQAAARFLKKQMPFF